MSMGAVPPRPTRPVCRRAGLRGSCCLPWRECPPGCSTGMLQQDAPWGCSTGMLQRDAGTGSRHTRLHCGSRRRLPVPEPSGPELREKGRPGDKGSRRKWVAVGKLVQRGDGRCGITAVG
uniref:Uncharacterized protein n=1 Tax=Nothoprocta perdicaria TaxID=30464 RepID=A0A8C6ZEX3_NOTPE